MADQNSTQIGFIIRYMVSNFVGFYHRKSKSRYQIQYNRGLVTLRWYICSCRTIRFYGQKFLWSYLWTTTLLAMFHIDVIWFIETKKTSVQFLFITKRLPAVIEAVAQILFWLCVAILQYTYYVNTSLIAFIWIYFETVCAELA